VARIKKELRPFQLASGEYVRHPATEELARTLNVCAYQPVPAEICPVHGIKKIIYVKTGISYCCAQENSVNDYNAALAEGEPTSALEAISRGLDYYWGSYKRNPFCGHSGKRTLSGGCYFCKEIKDAEPLSPRKAAVAAGESWYMPTEPCKVCGEIALKRVNNGECKSCTEKRSKPHVLPPHRQWPDMVISREDAIVAGWKTYRTGKPCKYGHTGWRWVSTRGCLTCQGRD